MSFHVCHSVWLSKFTSARMGGDISRVVLGAAARWPMVVPFVRLLMECQRRVKRFFEENTSWIHLNDFPQTMVVFNSFYKRTAANLVALAIPCLFNAWLYRSNVFNRTFLTAAVNNSAVLLKSFEQRQTWTEPNNNQIDSQIINKQQIKQKMNRK